MPKPANYSNARGAPEGAELDGHVSLFDYIRFTHDQAVLGARVLASKWDSLERLVDAQRFEGVRARFGQQVRDAAAMRDSIMTQYSNWYYGRGRTTS